MLVPAKEMKHHSVKGAKPKINIEMPIDDMEFSDEDEKKGGDLNNVEFIDELETVYIDANDEITKSILGNTD